MSYSKAFVCGVVGWAPVTWTIANCRRWWRCGQVAWDYQHISLPTTVAWTRLNRWGWGGDNSACAERGMNDLMATIDGRILLACSAGVLLGRVSVTILRPPSVRRWEMGEGKSEKTSRRFSSPHPLPYPSSCLSFTPSVELSFSIQSSTGLKNSRWRQNFLRCELSYEEISPALQARILLVVYLRVVQSYTIALLFWGWGQFLPLTASYSTGSLNNRKQ